ncbi:zinc finger protein jing homolog isoform X2 [Aricia agestis]|uniref:zinc finger protein jing homolog isoform X2 n=1 Tax=Aricia agestis TaxID=91739 RepID=UPI001C2057B5|nr:zinc finger protein jing homolog isoform X2 [Aricia agestis]
MLRHRPSGVAVLSPPESGGCSGSDITEPRSPRSPESACSTSEESANARMPPWANEPAPPGPRRLAVQPAPVRRPNPPAHRRITEYFNHKMKPQNGLKRDSAAINHDDTKKKCLPRNGVTNDLEKYISYLSQTLSPKVLLDVEKQKEAGRYPANPTAPGGLESLKARDQYKTGAVNAKGFNDATRPKESNEMHSMNGFVEIRHGTDPVSKVKMNGAYLNGLIENNKQMSSTKITKDPSANLSISTIKPSTSVSNTKVPIPATTEMVGMRLAPSAGISKSPKKNSKCDNQRINGVVTSTTKLDSRMNGVTCGSNNLSLNSLNKIASTKKEAPKKSLPSLKKTNRRSSACIANSKNLTWSKANNLKQQVQLQKQNCMNTAPNATIKPVVTEASSTPKMNLPNGIRQVSMTVNGNLSNMNVPVTNFQNCHQLNIPQPQCNGANGVTSTNLQSFVAVPQNVMLTTLRIPQNGLPAHTLSQQGVAGFNRPNVNVNSPSKLNGQIVFPFMQNLNGSIVQIPNMMAKVPSFVLPQSPQMATQRQDHLQNQQAAQFVFNGTLLKLASTIPAAYQNTNKQGPVTSQPIPIINKNVPGIQAMGVTVQPKTNFTVNFSHPVPHLVPQPGFIVTSVPNMNVKETWSYTGNNTVTSSQSSCSNQIVHQPTPIVTNFTTPNLHSSSIPIAPVKPPDNPIQGTEPPSSTVKEPEMSDIVNQKCDIPWLSKTVNNNFVPLDNKMSARNFSQISNYAEKMDKIESKVVSKEIDKEKSDVPRRKSVCKENVKIDEFSSGEDAIFTQITVMKDVSSSVQSTMIEANYLCTATESSESGIGTDKSIDSPSDSQGSKECDEDSSLSLSISLSSVEAQISQKSPILKQPKTIRFPPKSATKPESAKRTPSADISIVLCLWENCKKIFDSDMDLLDHLQSIHVESQAGKENYVCNWVGCKVRGKPSCSRLWLERHALSHGGNKPFRCIVEGCDRRFSTQILLERHVNNHFSETSSNSGSSKKSTESGSKLIRRNGKKLRYRRQPWSARMFDFFDAGTMEGLAYRLLRATRWRLGGACPLREPPGAHTLTLTATVAATRYNAAARRREALLTYSPPHVLDDEWVPEGEVRRFRRVEMASLPANTKVRLYEQFSQSYRKPPTPRPRRDCDEPCPLQPPPHPQPVPQSPQLQQTAPQLLQSIPQLPQAGPQAPQLQQPAVSGAAKRKMGRRYGGNSFWPCGR